MKTQNSFNNDNNTLYLVSTPIGNLSDITKRALDVLSNVKMILCEDTRVTSVLLNHYNIKTPLISYQKYNEKEKLTFILDKLKEHDIALVSDAGTPLISDPGQLLVNEASLLGFNVVAIPGASAAISSLIVSGLNYDSFTFIGFLPKKTNETKKIISSYIGRKETIVIYESPLRIKDTISLLYEILGNRNCSLGRELTKKYETIYRGNLLNASSFDFINKGEYSIVVEGDLNHDKKDINVIDKVNYYINHGLVEKDAIKLVSRELKVPKNEIYKIYKITNNDRLK